MINNVRDLLIDSAYGKMLNVASSYGKLVDKEEEKLDPNVRTARVDPETMKSILDGMEISGLDTFEYYVINKDGIISYHIDESMVGKPNRNQVMAKLLGNLHKGITPDNLCMEYEEDGVSLKSAVVLFTSDEKSYDEIMELYLTRKIVAMYTTLDEDELEGIL
jgi:hypothetical protein